MKIGRTLLQSPFILSVIAALGLNSICFGSFETRATIHSCQGDMQFVLFPEIAPITVMNFMQLSQDRFYNGTKFHRVARNFMIQGGDPLSREGSQNTGSGGLSYCIPAEFSDRKHVRGTLSMARRPNNPDSAGSQFFICLGNTPEYDGSYTIFGQLVEGFDVLNKIGNSEVTYSAIGERTQPIQPIVITAVSVIPLVPPKSPLIDSDWALKAPVPDSSVGQVNATAAEDLPTSSAVSGSKDRQDNKMVKAEELQAPTKAPSSPTPDAHVEQEVPKVDLPVRATDKKGAGAKQASVSELSAPSSSNQNAVVLPAHESATNAPSASATKSQGAGGGGDKGSDQGKMPTPQKDQLSTQGSNQQ